MSVFTILFTFPFSFNQNIQKNGKNMIILFIPVTFSSLCSEYDTSGMSYQNSEPGNMTRPGTDPGLPAPHMMSSQMTVPVVTVTSPASNARLELVD